MSQKMKKQLEKIDNLIERFTQHQTAFDGSCCDFSHIIMELEKERAEITSQIGKK